MTAKRTHDGWTARSPHPTPAGLAVGEPADHDLLGPGGGEPLLDELGRTQGGNNNGYCQDNPVTWVDWAAADAGLQDFLRGTHDLEARFVAAINEADHAHVA